jgi:thiosulfate/3-mercaptopyruvate sulfurtransferase
LVSTGWLAAHLGEAEVAILDATWFMPDANRDAKAEYAVTHIPGAVFFGIDEISDQDSDLSHMLSAPADFAVAARRLGVSRGSQVIVYDSHGLFSAARAWWNFRAMGHEKCSVLDGGLAKWIAEGRPVETGWVTPPHGDFKAHPDPALVRDIEAVRQALASGETQVVDARSAARFTGAAPEPRAGLRSGHMPGARNVPYGGLVTPSGELAGADQVRAAFEAAGVDLTRPITTTCGSGISAALLALALAQIGRPDVAVYDGSWSEWGARADTVVVRGEA